MDTERPEKSKSDDAPVLSPEEVQAEADRRVAEKQDEVGGPEGLEPTRYGDWEKKGRCFDF